MKLLSELDLRLKTLKDLIQKQKQFLFDQQNIEYCFHVC